MCARWVVVVVLGLFGCCGFGGLGGMVRLGSYVIFLGLGLLRVVVEVERDVVWSIGGSDEECWD